MTVRPKRIAIIGAGPIGLEAALDAVQNGYTVDLFERGRVADNVRQWGHVQLFSPFGLNASNLGREALSAAGYGALLPSDDAILTGREFAERYLTPLSRLPQLAERIHEAVTVLAVGRSQTWKGDFIGRPKRAKDPFRLLLEDASGQRYVDADYVFDCSGTYGNHHWAGAGGIPCIGETAALTDADYRLPDLTGVDRSEFSGKKTLIIGSGYSAATAVVALARIVHETPATRIVWITRSGRKPPINRIENDSLAERDRLGESANSLATSRDSPVEWRRGRLIVGIERPTPNGRYRVRVEKIVPAVDAPELRGYSEEIVVDRVIANVGYRPDRALYEELQVHECYASQGPIKLAAALLGETSADCLAQSGHGAETLRNPEPGLFILGAKSYGRDSRFLITIGLEQIRDAFSLIEFKSDATL